MSTTDIISLASAIIALFSALAAIISAISSLKAVAIAKMALSITESTFERASEMNKKMFKRQGVIELHMAWQGISNIDPFQPITPDVVRAINALSLTATLWNHDVIEREILYQSYWPSFRKLYESLENCSVEVPDTGLIGRDFLTKEIIKAYEDMKKMDINFVIQTKI